MLRFHAHKGADDAFFCPFTGTVPLQVGECEDSGPAQGVPGIVAWESEGELEFDGGEKGVFEVLIHAITELAVRGAEGAPKCLRVVGVGEDLEPEFRREVDHVWDGWDEVAVAAVRQGINCFDSDQRVLLRVRAVSYQDLCGLCRSVEDCQVGYESAVVVNGGKLELYHYFHLPAGSLGR